MLEPAHQSWLLSLLEAQELAEACYAPEGSLQPATVLVQRFASSLLRSVRSLGLQLLPGMTLRCVLEPATQFAVASAAQAVLVVQPPLAQAPEGGWVRPIEPVVMPAFQAAQESVCWLFVQLTALRWGSEPFLGSAHRLTLVTGSCSVYGVVPRSVLFACLVGSYAVP